MAKAKKRKKLPQPAYTGDHGPSTSAFTVGTVLEPVEGQEHNKTARRRRVEHWESMGLNLRQHGAAQEIRDAYCAVEMCSSGDAIKEAVDTSDRPDATIDEMIEAQSRLERAMRGVPKGIPRKIVEAILWENRDPDTLPQQWASVRAQFKIAMDLAANRLDAHSKIL